MLRTHLWIREVNGELNQLEGRRGSDKRRGQKKTVSREFRNAFIKTKNIVYFRLEIRHLNDPKMGTENEKMALNRAFAMARDKTARARARLKRIYSKNSQNYHD